MPVRVLLCLLLCCATGARAETGLLPRPTALEPAVRFWSRVFTEVDTRSGFLHDDRHLNVVYETVGWPEDLDRRQRQALIEPLVSSPAAIL
jgi:membrane-bound lytic murein transglycosylase D